MLEWAFLVKVWVGLQAAGRVGRGESAMDQYICEVGVAFIGRNDSVFREHQWGEIGLLEVPFNGPVCQDCCLAKGGHKR